MFLITGLGNPGVKYELTRHNIGFLVMDNITKNLSLKSSINKSSFNAEVIKASNKLYVKPQTFMNNSGQAIEAISSYYKIETSNIIVIHDDLDLPFGTVKFKLGGGHGGHNGLRSTDAHIGKEYLRVRVGIGKPTIKADVVNHVLSNFSKEELKQLEDIISHITKAIEALQTSTLVDVKSKYTLK